MIASGLKLLRSRYQLVAGPLVQDTAAQAWLGIDEDDSKYLIKLSCGRSMGIAPTPSGMRNCEHSTAWAVRLERKTRFSCYATPGSIEMPTASSWLSGRPDTSPSQER